MLENLNNELISQTNGPNFFKLCVIVTFNEYYQSMLLSMTLTLDSKSQGGRNFQTDCFNISKSTDLIKVKFGMHITFAESISCISILFVDFALRVR